MTVEEKKAARAAYQRKWRAANKERSAAIQRRYYEKHREQILAYQRAYKAANKEQAAALQRRYYEEHREKMKKKQRSYYKEHREEISAKRRAWYILNTEKVLEGQKAYRSMQRDMAAADALRAWRVEHGMTQQAAGARLGVTKMSVSRWECGTAPIPERVLEAIGYERPKQEGE